MAIVNHSGPKISLRMLIMIPRHAYKPDENSLRFHPVDPEYG
jgi:hypothetical protein